MVDKFGTFMRLIISSTCGFEPTLEVVEPYPNTIQVFIGGSPLERALIMGREGRNIAAFQRLALIFSRRNNVFSYIYVRPREEQLGGPKVDDSLEDAMNSIRDEK